MLARINRLAKQKDIELVHKKGKTLASKYFRAKFLRNSRDNSRATVVVSQKVSRLATERNKLKRQIRPFLGQQVEKIKIPLDIMLIVQPQAKSLSKEQLKKQLEVIFSKFSR